VRMGYQEGREEVILTFTLPLRRVVMGREGGFFVFVFLFFVILKI
jgi:hypothetical protein